MIVGAPSGTPSGAKSLAKAHPTGVELIDLAHRVGGVAVAPGDGLEVHAAKVV